MKQLSIILILIITVYSCSSNNNQILEEAVKTFYGKCVDKNDCIIELSSELNFNWEAMYIFGIGAAPRDISEIIGIEYNQSTDLTRLILFISGKQIVKEIRDVYDPEKPFVIQFEKGPWKIERKSSKFRIERPREGIYLLTHKAKD